MPAWGGAYATNPGNEAHQKSFVIRARCGEEFEEPQFILIREAREMPVQQLDRQSVNRPGVGTFKGNDAAENVVPGHRVSLPLVLQPIGMLLVDENFHGRCFIRASRLGPGEPLAIAQSRAGVLADHGIISVCDKVQGQGSKGHDDCEAERHGKGNFSAAVHRRESVRSACETEAKMEEAYRGNRQVAGVILVSRIFHPGFQMVSPATSTFIQLRDLSTDAR